MNDDITFNEFRNQYKIVTEYIEYYHGQYVGKPMYRIKRCDGNMIAWVLDGIFVTKSDAEKRLYQVFYK
jgi:hypothetical protein